MRRPPDDLIRPIYEKATRVLLGCGGRTRNNEAWLATDRYKVDLLDRSTFEKWWKPNTITAFLSEHVWEHLSEEEAERANSILFDFLKPGGWFRIAVPDGFNPNPKYIDHVKVGGDNQYHKQLYNYKTLTAQLEKAGFKVEPLEYFNENGELVLNKWDKKDGFLRRCSFNLIRLRKKDLSLVVDAFKPLPDGTVKRVLEEKMATENASSDYEMPVLLQSEQKSDVKPSERFPRRLFNELGTVNDNDGYQVWAELLGVLKAMFIKYGEQGIPPRDVALMVAWIGQDLINTTYAHFIHGDHEARKAKAAEMATEMAAEAAKNAEPKVEPQAVIAPLPAPKPIEGSVSDGIIKVSKIPPGPPKT